LAAHPQAMWWLAEAPAWAVPAALLGVFWWLLPRGARGWLAGLLLCLPLLWPARSARPRAAGAAGARCRPGHGGAGAHGAACSLVRRGAADRGRGQRADPGSGTAGARPGAAAAGAAQPRRPGSCRQPAGLRLQLPGCNCWRRRAVRSPGLAVASAACAGTGTGSISGAAPAPGSRRAENEDSCVLRVASAHGVVLLPGDIGRPAEQALLRASPAALKADVVLVPHHGSGGSSSAPWVAAVAAAAGSGLGRPPEPLRPPAPGRGPALAGARRRGGVHGGVRAIRVWLGAQGLQLREQRIHASRWWDAAGRARSAAILSPIEQAAVGPEG
jgi:competence protein ComEC